MGKGLIKKLRDKREKREGSIEDQPEVKTTFEKVTRNTVSNNSDVNVLSTGSGSESGSGSGLNPTPPYGELVDPTGSGSGSGSQPADPYEALKVPPHSSLYNAITFATNLFASNVTLGNYNAKDRATNVVKSFAPDAVLRATVSAVDRLNKDHTLTTPTIFNYFKDYFSASVIPGLRVSNAKYNVMKLVAGNDDILMNHAYVEFSSDGALPIIARMTFTFSKNHNSTSVEDLYLIQVLDSSQLHDPVPDPLVKQGDKFTYWDPTEPKVTLIGKVY